MRLKGKKKALSQLMMTGGLDRAATLLQPSRLTVFNFHRIRPDSETFATDFDEEVFGPTVSDFRTHMRWLKANTELLSERQLLRLLSEGKAPPRRSTMVTFDDGYVDNYELALPVLKELGVPATFFIPVQSIEQRKVGWWDQIAYILKRARESRFELDGQEHWLGEGYETLKTRFYEWMKFRSAAESETVVADLARACRVELPTAEQSGRELMTWAQIRELYAAGLAIGSHTYSHRVLATLSLDEQREELRRSKADIEARLGAPVRTLAYPVGGYEHFNAETQAIARECGYEAAFSFHTGVNLAGALGDHRFDIRRISAPEETSLYCGSVALPGLVARRKCELDGPVAAGPRGALS